VVEKFIGDAVVGVSGFPWLMRTIPEHAVRAALRVIEDVGASELGIEVRIAYCSDLTVSTSLVEQWAAEIEALEAGADPHSEALPPVGHFHHRGRLMIPV
jgi:hypothetical protein